MTSPAQALIARLELERHPEGGYFREVHRSNFRLPHAAIAPAGYDGDRCAVTSILFLLPAGEQSAWHRVASEEIFLYQSGDPLELELTDSLGEPTSAIRRVTVGPGETQQFQRVVNRNEWQRARATDGPLGFSLVACVVAPGFEFDDFEIRPNA